jgi:hypothetical protein
MIHIVEEMKLLLLPGNRMVMTSRLAKLVRRIHVSIQLVRRCNSM